LPKSTGEIRIPRAAAGRGDAAPVSRPDLELAMSVAELLAVNYAWADTHAWHILAVALAVPALGTPLAWIASRAGNGRRGRRIASFLVGIGLVAVAFEAACLLVAHGLLGHSPLDANAVLLAAPVVCVAASIGGIGTFVPVRELASVRAACDIGLFLAAGAGALWLLSKFRGWGFLFLGWAGDAIVIAVLGGLLLRKLYRRAFGPRSADDPRAPAAPAPPRWTAG
jgi:hypothetical protein